MSKFTKGKLLVASPLLGDPNFFRAVVLMLEHTSEGALGVIINRATDTAIAEALPGWHDIMSEPRVAFIGGPVVPEGALCLALRPPGIEPEGWDALIGDLGAVDLEIDPEKAESAFVQARIFAGHAGWGPGQLEGELDEGAWFVIGAEPEDVFDPEPDKMWARVLRRQQTSLSLMSTFTDEPELN